MNLHVPCGHPGCPIDQQWPQPFAQCVLNQPLCIYIPAGQHMHMACPAHPEGHIIYGSSITY